MPRREVFSKRRVVGHGAKPPGVERLAEEVSDLGFDREAHPVGLPPLGPVEIEVEAGEGFVVSPGQR